MYYLISGVAFLILGIGLLIVAILYSKRRGKLEKVKEAPGGEYLVRLYRFFSSFFITKDMIEQIRYRIESTYCVSERILRKKVITIFLYVLGSVFTLGVITIIISKSALMLLFFSVIIWFIAEMIVEIFVTNIKNKILSDQLRFNELIRHEYFASKTVDDAVYNACSLLSSKEHEVYIQGQKIYDVLNDKDVEKKIVEYNEVAPNKYFKMLLALSYMTKEYGDYVIEGTSVFMKNISDLTNEIRIELTKRHKISRALATLNIISLLPLIFMTPIRMWASKYFVPLKMFYETKGGIFLQIATIIIIFTSFIALRKIQRFNDRRVNKKSSKLSDKIYNVLLKKSVDFIGGLNKYRNYNELKQKLDKVLSPLSPEMFVTQKVIYFAALFILSLIIATAININTRKNVLNSPTLPDHFLGGEVSEKELEIANEITIRDNGLLLTMDAEWTIEMINEMLLNSGYTIDEADIASIRLYKKKSMLYKSLLSEKEMVVVIVLSIIGFYIPDINLEFRKRILKVEAEDEVAGFSSIIVMLMSHERLGVLEILEWLEIYSVTFKDAISDCINDYSSGATGALLSLASKTQNERFLSIINSLISATNDLSIREAFMELSDDKEYFLQQRKMLNEEIIEKKINAGKAIGFLPVYSLIILYMAIPMVVSAMNDMMKYFEQLKI